MKIGFAPEQFFDNDGNVLAAGRISLYYHNSDNLVPLYHYQGNEYVAAQNPIIANESGRIDGVFFDSCIVTVKIEKHLEDDTFEQIDTYEYGIDVPGGNTDTVVNGVSALKEAATTLGTVTVVGYHNAYDCGPRTYVWDENSTDQADDGCVVASNIEPTGRWLLLWNDEKLPAAFYGVTPGNTSNMAALMARPRIYGGSYSIVAPGTTSFPGGNFSTGVTSSYTTTYDLCLDRATRFGDLAITAPRFSVSGLATEAEGNFQIRMPDGTGQELKLSLVKSRTQIGATNAQVIIIDRDNTVGSASITLSGKLVYAYIEIPSWLTFEDSIVIENRNGNLTAKTFTAQKVHATNELKVGRYLKVVPHENVMDPYYEIYSQGNMNYPTMRLGSDQNVTFHNGIEVREGISIPPQGNYSQQWWGYFDGDTGPQIQIRAEGNINVTGPVNATSYSGNSATLSNSLTLSNGAHFYPGKILNINMTGYLDEDTDVNLSDWVLNKNELAYIRLRLSLTMHDSSHTYVGGLTRYNVKLYNGTYLRLIAGANDTVTHEFFLIPVMVSDSNNLPYIYTPLPHIQEFPTDGKQLPETNHTGFLGWFNGVQPL